MEEGFQNLCKNSTNDFDNCYNDTITNKTVQPTVELTPTLSLDLQVKYYCEGVILVPLAIAGLFGKKYIKL